MKQACGEGGWNRNETIKVGWGEGTQEALSGGLDREVRVKHQGASWVSG